MHPFNSGFRGSGAAENKEQLSTEQSFPPTLKASLKSKRQGQEGQRENKLTVTQEKSQCQHDCPKMEPQPINSGFLQKIICVYVSKALYLTLTCELEYATSDDRKQEGLLRLQVILT